MLKSTCTFAENYKPLAENYKYMRRKLHILCRKMKMKLFICRNQQMKNIYIAQC